MVGDRGTPSFARNFRQTQIVVITVSTVTLVVIHTPASAQVINEFLADPAFGIDGDANGDGVRDALDDEFIEIVNDTDSDIDLSGWTLSDSLGMRHTFADGTALAPDCAIIVFGGGSPTGSFGNAEWQTAGGLALNNTGDTITLANDGSVVVDQVVYGSMGGANQSLTRNPDVTGPLTQHTFVPGSGGVRFSPGVRVDGTPFPGCPSYGDCNGDGVLDLLDFAALDSCVDDGGLAKSECVCFDLDDDTRVGLLDWGMFQAAFGQ